MVLCTGSLVVVQCPPTLRTYLEELLIHWYTVIMILQVWVLLILFVCFYSWNTLALTWKQSNILAAASAAPIAKVDCASNWNTAPNVEGQFVVEDMDIKDLQRQGIQVNDDNQPAPEKHNPPEAAPGAASPHCFSIFANGRIIINWIKLLSTMSSPSSVWAFLRGRLLMF